MHSVYTLWFFCMYPVYVLCTCVCTLCMRFEDKPVCIYSLSLYPVWILCMCILRVCSPPCVCTLCMHFEYEHSVCTLYMSRGYTLCLCTSPQTLSMRVLTRFSAKNRQLWTIISTFKKQFSGPGFEVLLSWPGLGEPFVLIFATVPLEMGPLL